MSLDQILQDQKLFSFPPGVLDRALDFFPHAKGNVFVRDLFAANLAEWTAFGAPHFKQAVPLVLPSQAASWIVYKTNTIQITCSAHEQPNLARRAENIFLFVSDCWKVREITGQDPLMLFSASPPDVATTCARLLDGSWQFAPGEEKAVRRAFRLTVMLWAIKAVLFDQPPDHVLSARTKSLVRHLGIDDEDQVSA